MCCIQTNIVFQDIGEEWIKETFQKYGKIELIEVFSNENNTKWAYLTYLRDEEAHLALTEGSTLIEIEQILPADTWCQPSSLSSGPVPTQDTINEILNEFKVANIGERSKDVSGLLRQLISLSSKSNSESLKETLNNRILPSAKKFDFELGDNDNEKRISLNEARLILRCVGPYICDLGLNFKMDKYPNNIDRYLFKICQYIGPNLTTIRLKFFPTNRNWLLHLQPLLRRIECLCLQTSNYDFDYDIDLQLHCPNLKTLKISMNLKGELLSKKAWPKLERFSNLHNQFMEERLVLDFMKNNPQLKYLKIEANDSNNLLQQISIHLPQLEKLCLYQGYPDICADNLGESIK